MPDKKRRWRRIAKVVLPLVLFGAVLHLLVREIRKIDPAAILAALEAITWQQGLIAGGLTVISYLILSTYDLVGVRYVKREVSTPRVILTSFVTYSFNYTFGTILGAVGMRLRYYSLLKLSAEDITKVAAFAAVTSWIGYSLLAGTLFVAAPLPVPERFDVPFATLRPLGLLLLVLAVGYLVLCWRRVPELHIRSWRFKLPTLKVALTQFVPSVANWLVVGTIVYVLMPAEADVSYVTIVSVYLLGAVAGIIVRVPAGLGVLEGAFLLTLSPTMAPAAILASLLAFRLVYFMMPLVAGIAAAAVAEYLFRSSAAPAPARVPARRQATPACDR